MHMWLGTTSAINPMLWRCSAAESSKNDASSPISGLKREWSVTS